MTVRIGINGFGRIGRQVYRVLRQRRLAGSAPDLELVAVNDVVDVAQLAPLLELDSVGGRLDVAVEPTDGGLSIGGEGLRVVAHPEPAAIPWRDLGVDVVIESTRLFTAAKDAAGHLQAGASLVIVAAPSDGADATFVAGVNDHTFEPGRHRVVSNASCTTNCLAPMVKVLDEAFGIEQAMMTTVHAYTSEQNLVDLPQRDPRRARAAAINIVPTTTGAARAIGLVIDTVAGRLDGSALRVPVPDGSITDLTALLAVDAGVDDVNDAFRAAAENGPLAGILAWSDRPLVSSDIVGRPEACIFDAPLTIARGRMTKVFGWYDNEWGYTNRLVELTARLTSRRAATNLRQ
jgi:glyceraldehyde 3-phosphate dehydrogenase